MDYLQPLSRAKPPEEFTLRVTCAPSPQLSLGGPQDGGRFELGERQVLTSVDSNGSLVLVVKGLSTKDEGRGVFEQLRRLVAHVGVNDRLAVAMPEEVSEPAPWGLTLFPGDAKAIAHGWPAGQLASPLAVYNIGAWLYPEHEYVILLSAIAFFPTFQTSLSSATDALSAAAQRHVSSSRLQPEVALAATYFSHAVRSTMAVWRLSLMVTSLEMLASRTAANKETMVAIAQMREVLKARFSNPESDVDVERLDNCLRDARQESIGSAVRNLVVRHCAPGVARNPLTSIFSDEDNCRKKISALYSLRSKYSHEGRVASTKGLKGYSMDELQHVAQQALGHILNELIVDGDVGAE